MLEDIQQPFQAQQVLQAFRQGTVAKDSAHQLMVGREYWVEALCDDLDFVRSGASKIRFLSAAYGGGKSHFLSAVEHIATDKGFIVANVELHSREAPLDRFEIVFPKIMRSLTSVPGSFVLEEVFYRWLASAQLYDRQSITRELRAVSPSLDFQAALRAFLDRAESNQPQDEEVRQAILGWLCGDALSPLLRKNTNIRNRISITNVSEIFGSFLRLVRRSDLAGVAIFLDEAEAVTSLARSQKRAEANQNIRKLLDNADRYEGLLIVFSTTPAFLNDSERGARSYPALWDRIRTVMRTRAGMKPNKRSLIIKLEPPGKAELRQAASIVRRLHAVAYSWQAEELFPADAVDALVAKYLDSCPQPVYRPFLRALVELLDSLEQSASSEAARELISQMDFGEYTEDQNAS